MGENRLMADLYAENERLKARISELESKHFVECTIISQYDDELKEAKRLLKMAMEDMKILYESGKDEGCYGIKFKWRYADEALKLIESCILLEVNLRLWTG